MCTVIHLDKGTYSTTAVLTTSLELSDKLTIAILDSDREIKMEVTCCDGTIWNEDTEKLLFETLAQAELRTRLHNMFAPIEKLIVEKAFAPVSK